MPAHAKHKHLLKDSDVKRWYDNLARGSIITAEERLRRLGRFSEATGLGPKVIVERKRASPEGFDDFVMDYVDKSLKKDKPAQVRNNLITLRSWLEHFGLRIDKKIKLPPIDFVDEVVPTKEQLGQILRHCDPRSRMIASLIAFCGLRPESIGNYLGTDGLKMGDLPELQVKSREIEFKTIPAKVVVRKALSKARHQYFTFLPEEGCQYLREYLGARIRAGEELGSGSPVIGHVREGTRLPFLRTTKAAWEVKLAIKAAGFGWRPYVLRSYCDTAFDIAESKGFISHPWRQFFMGHKGDMEARYSTNKSRLTPDMIEEMRGAYRRCEPLLQTTKAEPEEERIREAFKEQLLLVAGFSKEEVSKMDLGKVTDGELQQTIRQKLLGIMTNNGQRQKIVSSTEVEGELLKGWEFVASLGERAIMKIPG